MKAEGCPPYSITSLHNTDSHSYTYRLIPQGHDASEWVTQGLSPFLLRPSRGLAGLYRATARLVASNGMMMMENARAPEEMPTPPAVIAWFNPQHPDAPICRVFNACE